MRKLIFAVSLLIGSVGCNSAPNQPAASPEPAKAAPKTELQTGRVVLQKLYTTARMWASDAQPIRLESQAQGPQSNEEAKENIGKAPLWRGSFASPARGLQKPFMWSGLAGPDAPERGITPGSEDSFSPNNTFTQPFDLAYLKTDSEKAFEVAQAHGGSALLKKSPKTPVNYVLDWDPRKKQLVWHVIYGQNPHDPQLQIAVDASTGGYIRKEV